MKGTTQLADPELSDSSEDYLSGAYEPVTCHFANSTVGLLAPPNCTVPCHNSTASWNQTEPDNSTCYSSYSDLQSKLQEASPKIYNCTVGFCSNGTCISNHTYAECW
ncbi:evasin P672 isoform X2 [Rhipicephalus sanguineus]|uniref:evasin P672 isoform X2 n=1 Tax=Rhipicephalus sanguineus TaxID=34632 RepID=UPI0020C57F8E|nr:evasin P672 isoform X2 [Rhipicephalus sanguineus]